MEDNSYFKTQRFFVDKEKSTNSIYSDDLLALISNEELKELLINKYDLDQNLIIEIDGIDQVFDHVKRYAKRFDLIRLEVADDQITSFIQFDDRTNDALYKFNIASGLEDDVLYEDMEVTATYDSVNLFYKDKDLTQYVKSLKKHKNMSNLLDELNVSWKNYYARNPKLIKKRLYRILKHNENYYLKSINTNSYKEYGIKESFVVAILELFKLKNENSDFDFEIASILLSESEIDLIISKKKGIKLGNGAVVRNSISIRNNDQGNASFGIYSTLEIYTEKGLAEKIFVFPNKDDQAIKTQIKSAHTVTADKFVEIHSEICVLLNKEEELKDNYHFLKDTVDFDQLRQKIEERLITNNSAFKGVVGLKDLFKRDKAGHVDNLAKLLSLCGKAELLDMNSDIRFKLRYLISNVLLYNKNSI